MGYKNGTQPASIALSYAHRDALKRLTSLIAFVGGKPVFYGQAITEAERILRAVLNDPELRERFAPAPKPTPTDHVCVYESATEPVPADAS